MATAVKKVKTAKISTKKLTNKERCFITGYYRGIEDYDRYRKSFGAYSSASRRYYKGLKASDKVSKISKRHGFVDDVYSVYYKSSSKK